MMTSVPNDLQMTPPWEILEVLSGDGTHRVGGVIFIKNHLAMLIVSSVDAYQGVKQQKMTH